MQEAGALRILAFADPFQLGNQVLAFALLRVQARNLESIVETLTAWPEASYVSTLLGRWDVYVQLVCPDVEELWDLVTNRIRTLEGVLEIETIMEMSVHKFTYKYPALGSFSDTAEPG